MYSYVHWQKMCACALEISHVNVCAERVVATCLLQSASSLHVHVYAERFVATCLLQSASSLHEKL